MAYKKLEDVFAYKISSGLSDYVWERVAAWNWFAKQTIGKQFVNAIDSIAANLAEGFGSYYKRVKTRYYYQARGSVFESAHWSKKAFERKLLTEKQYKYIIDELRKLPKEINYQIKLVSSKLKI